VTTDPVLIEPETAAEAADALRRASAAGTSIVIRGAGTKDGWGRRPSRIDAVLDMRRLNRILAHEHGDMTATIEAGATLREANAALAIHGQTLPLDPPHLDRATIGGVLATNDSGPLRHRYGTPRDLVIGIQLATTDGVLSKAGGQVVKNVAGYDLSKLVTGSFGSLAAIVSATFKLAPLPAASKTMRIAVKDEAALADVVRTMMASQLEPMAFEVHAGSAPDVVQAFRPAVLLRFASLPDAVEAQIAQATAGLKACTTAIDVLDGDAERSLWQAHANELWDAPGAIVRAGWLPANIAAALDELASMELVGRAAIGAGHIRIDGGVTEQADAIERLRASKVFGNVVIVRGSQELKAVVDVWGSHGTRQPLFDSLKMAFDPRGVLNAGRGPL
jgi:glycolate oxidase FAD binding subunit